MIARILQDLEEYNFWPVIGLVALIAFHAFSIGTNPLKTISAWILLAGSIGFQIYSLIKIRNQWYKHKFGIKLPQNQLIINMRSKHWSKTSLEFLWGFIGIAASAYSLQSEIPLLVSIFILGIIGVMASLICFIINIRRYHPVAL